MFELTGGQYDELTLLSSEIKGIGLFLHNLEITAIQGTSRESLWNFGEALMGVADRIKKVTDALKETPTDSESQ
jgi:hypothetical protein